MQKTDIKSMTEAELAVMLKDLGQPKFRAGQIFKWLHSGVCDFDLMTDIPLSLRNTLKESCYIADVEIIRRLESQIDGTVKYLYRLYDGQTVEVTR